MNFFKQTIVIALFVVPAAFAAEPAKQTAEPAAAQAPRPAEVTPAAQADKPASSAAGPAVRTSTAARADRLDLDTTVVTGNRELPKVLYIVPWKKADIGELPAQPFNTLLDEVLTPVDRDVFRREVTYYEAVAGGAQPAPVPNAAPAARPEK
jgi:hypothetical protein